ncbi:MOSC domain-containing protein [Rubrobacter marinus]|uniref:MOSC domain-containing protein n=1 Tax=Rubrobacter marinus TaxID=2653852 RepID=A0A6G8PZ59_9ACTN|nr:MOSC domain-containing protein [Rubrobacter marinus]QIN79524.1 MOSC domain-containing protein [Rubrobacter marinus]
MRGVEEGWLRWRGAVVSVHVDAGAPMRAAEAVRAVRGRGLEGDRYQDGRGYYSDHPGPMREVSLIEEETVEALERDHGMVLSPGETRRNVMTRGVPLDHLVGRELQVGEAILEGVELCEPCVHLVAVTGKRGLLPDLVHRGGLHARVVESGTVRSGAPVEELRDGGSF